MNTERADQTAEDKSFESREVYVVSNREPYVHEFSGDDIAVSRPVGGLTSALDPVLQELGGTWIAWGSGDADVEVVDDTDRVGVPPESSAYELRRVWIDESTLQGYYYGFSNQVLWPICHGFLGNVNYEEGFWERYREVNEQFASVVEREVRSTDPENGTDDSHRDTDDPIVWIHDYHFGVAPGRLRDRLPAAATLAFFWHVPWPPWDLFRRCPHHRAILDGILSNDVVGVHTQQDRRHLVQCAREAFDATYDSHTGSVIHDDHRTTVRVAPVPVDHGS
ncbi:MAG: trehalose-6-phosphate synthase, partial [Halodesulfurarchaeum sp.]